MSSASNSDHKFSGTSEMKNQEAKKCLKNKEYHEAIGLLTEAIRGNPSVAEYYCNRAFAYYSTQDYKSSLHDCAETLRIDDSFYKAYNRQHACHIAEGDFGAALIALRQYKKFRPDDKEINEKLVEVEKLKTKEEKLNLMMKEEKLDIAVVSDLIDYLSRHATSCKRFKHLKAECAANKGNFKEAEAILQNLDPNDPEVIYLQGLVFYFQDRIDEAIKYMKNALIKLPDLPKAQKYNRILKEINQYTTEGKIAFGKKDFTATVNIFTKAMEVAEISNMTKARLLTNRAVAYHNLNNFQAEIDDCTEAITNCNPNSDKAFFQRASGYKNLKRYEEALLDFEKAMKLNRNEKAEKEFDEIVAILEATTTEYHQILHLSPNATKKEIRKSFLALSKKFHPDQHKGTSKEKWFNQWYTKIQEANKELSKTAK